LKDAYLIAERDDTKLAVQYESIRRQEFELITQLLQVLPKIDGVGDDQLAQMRDALFHADTPYLMVFVGPFNSGKSSLINALLGKDDLLPVGITPTTDRITMLRYGDTSQRARMGDTDTVFYPSPLLQKVSFVDTPGLESIFKTHEEETRRFLHRSDVVMLIMLATQAMTAGDLDNLRLLKEYGKTVIIILNQRDLLTDDKVEEVRQHVTDQSRAQLGYQPDIWLMSARRGNEARQADGSVDNALWEESGLSQLERYLDRQLSDAARLRQKLRTPLQITQNVHQSALDSVRGNQSALNQYQSLSQNIEIQMAGYKRELDTLTRTTLNDVTVNLMKQRFEARKQYEKFTALDGCQ
jgi:predicted GTPase